MSLKLRDNLTSKLNYAVHLCEDRICCIVEILVEVVRIDMRMFSCLDSTLGPSFVLSPTSCSPGLIFVLWGVCGQVILRDLIWSFIGIMPAVGILILLVEDGHLDVAFWGVTLKV